MHRAFIIAQMTERNTFYDENVVMRNMQIP